MKTTEIVTIIVVLVVAVVAAVVAILRGPKAKCAICRQPITNAKYSPGWVHKNGAPSDGHTARLDVRRR